MREGLRSSRRPISQSVSHHGSAPKTNDLVPTTNSDRTVTRSGLSTCAGCDSYDLVVNEEHCYVCQQCGHVNGYYWNAYYQKPKTYKTITHFNERLAQYFLVEPPMPDELYDMVELEAFEPSYPNFEDLTKEDIKKICKSIKLPKNIQEKYRSKKFKKKPLINLSRFVEKWLSIKNRLCGSKPNYPSGWVVDQLRTRFCQLQVPFEMTRHKPECDGRTYKCHKVYKCRHNLINYNFIIIELLKLIIQDDKLVETEFLPCFPQLKSKTKVKQLRIMWDKMMKWIGWGQVYPIQTAKQRLLNYLGSRYSMRSEMVMKKRCAGL